MSVREILGSGAWLVTLPPLFFLLCLVWTASDAKVFYEDMLWVVLFFCMSHA